MRSITYPPILRGGARSMPCSCVPVRRGGDPGRNAVRIVMDTPDGNALS